MKQFILNLLCKHSWVELKHFEIPSRADSIRKMGFKPTTWDSLKRQYVTDYTCTKCGNLKRFKETTY